MTQENPATFYEAIEFFIQKPWSDGMPVVPPTKERVEEMLPGHPCIELPHPIYYLSKEALSELTRKPTDEVVRQVTAG